MILLMQMIHYYCMDPENSITCSALPSHIKQKISNKKSCVTSDLFLIVSIFVVSRRTSQDQEQIAMFLIILKISLLTEAIEHYCLLTM